MILLHARATCSIAKSDAYYCGYLPECQIKSPANSIGLKIPLNLWDSITQLIDIQLSKVKKYSSLFISIYCRIGDETNLNKHP
jgi:hypothetical protein